MRWYCSKSGMTADFQEEFGDYPCSDGPDHEIHRGNPKNQHEDDDFEDLLDERIQDEENELIDEYGEEVDSNAAAFNAGWNWVPPEEESFEDDENENDDQK